MDKLTVAEIKERYAQTGKAFACEGEFVLVAVSSKETRTGSFYAVMTLQDATGSLQAKKWDVDPEKVNEQKLGGRMFDVRLEVESYQNQMSAVVAGIRGPKEVSLEELLVFSGLDVNQHSQDVQTLERYLSECDGSDYGKVMRACLDEDTWQKLCYVPASITKHHSHAGGLVRHICEIIETGLVLLDGMRTPYEKEYFLAGAILHDLGKVDTYMMPPQLDYQIQGKLAPHQVWSLVRIGRVLPQVDIDLQVEIKLVHIIEQAHGDHRQAVWQKPLGPEPKALALADNFSAQMHVDPKEEADQNKLDSFGR